MGDDLRQTLDSLKAALTSLVRRDPKPTKALYSHAEDVTLFGGFGAYERGWDQVAQKIEFVADHFPSGQLLGVEPLAMGASGDLAYNAWIERFELTVEGRDEPAPYVLRVTHIFRRENGAWRIIHRQGDQIVDETDPVAAPQH